MLDSVNSAMGDFNDAIDLIRSLTDRGIPIDPGYYVKTYTSRGELYGEDEAEKMREDYRMAASYLPEFREGSKYYEPGSAVAMCLDCAEDLIDADFYDSAAPFIEKGFEICDEQGTDHFKNASVDLLNMAGQVAEEGDDPEKALRYFTRAVSLASELDAGGRLEDRLTFVYALVAKGDCEEDLGMEDERITDHEAALQLMEEMLLAGTLDDKELVSNLHGELAKAYMKKGDVSKAEKHMLRQISFELTGSDDYLRDNGIDRSS